MLQETETMTPRILVLHVPAGGGHRAAAQALVEQAHDRGVEAELCDALHFTPRWFAAGYVQAHLRSTEHAPSLYGLGYRRLDRRHPIADGVRRRVDRAVGGELLRYVRARRPDVVIATHFYPLSVLGAARLSGALDAPLVGVVTDFAAHAWWAEPGVDAYCTAPGGPALDLARHGVPPAHIAQTGIPVREAFGRIPPLSHDGELRVLVTSGGFGIGPLATTLRSFAGFANMHLTVVCGASERRVSEARRAVAKARLSAQVIGFEKDMPARLAEAHVLVGKPGGLTTSEALAAGRPMVIVGTCPGQEQHNEEWLTLNGAAVAARAEHAGARVSWLRQSGQLASMARAARRLGTPTAACDILDVALAGIVRNAA
jgi:processive 1,2-diacylglycerol beta-glucosyltransferase